MKQDPITKLYDRLTLKERAALSFHHTIQGDRLEVTRVCANVERKQYICNDMELYGWWDAFMRVANVWAMEHWVYRNHVSALLAGTLATLHNGKEVIPTMKAVEEYIASLRYWESCLLALDEAIDAVCNAHGFDVECVRKLARTSPYKPICEAVIPVAIPDAVMLKEWTELFNSLLASIIK